MAYDENLTDEEIDQIRDMQEVGSNYGYPTPPSKESIFKFFRFLLGMNDSSKVGNLNNTELGKPTMSVRGLQEIALYSDAEGWDTVSQFLRSRAEITLSTSLSKQGKLLDTFVTQIKKEKKESSMPEKKGWFMKKKEDSGDIS